MLLTSTDAARELGVSSRQVRRHASNGVLEGSQIGTAYLLAPVQIRAHRRMTHRGRHWTDVTRVAALDLLSTGATAAMAGSELSRLRRRVRDMDVGTVAGQIIQGTATLRRALSVDQRRRFAPTILNELGLSTGGGIGVIVAEHPDRAARSERLALDAAGDVATIQGREEHRRVLEALLLFAYGDTRESDAAGAWITAAASRL
ncbi:hypothetical protein SCB71_07250 [Herbiconiux sp. KACC 21604]|uniref:hypothetical protein n=1 Tax=unclassified Herbiconiux TaxID=2618217 RepID=UPI001491ADF1|nr:hypothetical protein [Herbiconiux sp. SALV-R1]QJU53087.1 hypothetical protein HL652_05225 [Herbiconiux sp. SALV-R1]WPO88021.1 hypothetical protein SCB71_07250 [Herbiconiux sp. KACC 21604]